MNNEPEPQRKQHSEEDFKWSLIHRLRQLNNIDKHQCLPALGVGVARLIRWSGDDMWFRYDDTILGSLGGADTRNIEWETEFALVLTDDPIHKTEAGKYEPQDCRELLKSFADAVNITAWEVLSRYYDELNPAI
jgi:hypothetical protein